MNLGTHQIEVGWAPGTSGNFGEEKNLPVPGFESRTVQRVANR